MFALIPFLKDIIIVLIFLFCFFAHFCFLYFCICFFVFVFLYLIFVFSPFWFTLFWINNQFSYTSQHWSKFIYIFRYFILGFYCARGALRFSAYSVSPHIGVKSIYYRYFNLKFIAFWVKGPHVLSGYLCLVERVGKGGRGGGYREGESGEEAKAARSGSLCRSLSDDSASAHCNLIFPGISCRPGNALGIFSQSFPAMMLSWSSSLAWGQIVFCTLDIPSGMTSLWRQRICVRECAPLEPDREEH